MAPRSLFVADDRDQPRRYAQTGLAKSIAGQRKIGLDDDSIADLIQSSALFNWANRLMLSIGEPTAAV